MHTNNIRIYNENALAMADKFDAIGVRLADIEETLALVKNNPKVLEIGCGNGRDAFEICKRTTDYLGVDASEKLIELARKKSLRQGLRSRMLSIMHSPEDWTLFSHLLHSCIPRKTFQKKYSIRYLKPLIQEGFFVCL